jgi:hypothetical protein
VGLALAVYLSSASTIAATPVAVPVATQGKANPKALDDDSKKSEKERNGDDNPHSSSSGGTTTSGGTSTDDHIRLRRPRRLEQLRPGWRWLR